MTILAIMQNMWVRDPAMLQRGIAKYGERYRRKAIRYALFAGCISGRRIKEAFGEELCRAIEWEEASPEITDNPNACPKADESHIRAAIERYQPTVIITFGLVATKAVDQLWKGHLIIAPHPAARQPSVQRELRIAAGKLRLILEAARALGRGEGKS